MDDSLESTLAAAFKDAGQPIDTQIDAPPAPAPEPSPSPAPVQAEPAPEPSPTPEPPKADAPKPSTPPAPAVPSARGLPPGVPKGAKAAPVVPAPVEPKDPDSVKMPASLTGKNQEGWKALHASAKENHQAFVKERDENKKLRASLADRASVTAKEFDAMKKENDELRGLRSRVDMDADPEYLKEYAEPFKQSEATLTDFLKKHGVSDEQIKAIDFNKKYDVDVVKKALEEHADLATATQFEEQVKAFITAKIKHDGFKEKFSKNYTEFMAEREKQRTARTVEYQAKLEQNLETIRGMKKEGTEEPAFPFLVKYDPPPNATPEQAKQVEAHNGMVDAMQAKLQNVLKAEAPDERAAVAVAAVSASYLQSIVRILEGELKAARDEIGKISVAGEIKPNAGARKAVFDGNTDLDSALAESFPGMK